MSGITQRSYIVQRDMRSSINTVTGAQEYHVVEKIIRDLKIVLGHYPYF